MSESADWKQKYRDLLAESSTEEQRWRQTEKVLRRLVNRLCAAGMGVDPRLDDELSALAAANRRHADATELEALAATLTTAVSAVDRVAPVYAADVPRAPQAAERWNAACAAAGAIVENLASIDAERPPIGALRAQLPRVRTDAELAAILLRAADLIRERYAQITDDRVQAAALLTQVGRRLDELVEYFAASDAENRGGFAASEALGTSVMAQVRELSQEALAATDLARLRGQVSARLESVGTSVREFRDRAQARLHAQTAHTESMRARVAALEGERRELQDRLDDEKNRSRIDPLTNVPNRKAFEERMAQEIARKGDGESAVALLIWDIDDFKAINDTYGHRAGDRVLRSVAANLASGLRVTDFLARIGGEEFAILLVGMPLQTAARIADELRAGIESLRFHFRGTPVRVTASCGITVLMERDTAELAFDRADAALYRAKSAGKNLCVGA